MDEKNELQSGTEAELDDATKKHRKKKKGPKSQAFADNVIRDSETAKERGRQGGIKSGEARRGQRDARDSIQFFLGKSAKSKAILSNLEELGIEDSERTNMMALQGRLFTMAMAGNLDAYLVLMRIGGYDPEENRRERESIASDARRERELEAKVNALGRDADMAQVALNLSDEDDNNDVVIYMPQIQSEESCTMKESEAEGVKQPESME